MRANGRLVSIVSFIIAVAAFLLLTSVAIVWAGGLTYDPRTHTFNQTSMIVVDETVSGAQVFLNNHLISETTPYNIRYLNPGEYDLKVSKDGFVACEKTYTLARGQVAEFAPVLIATKPTVSKVAAADAPTYIESNNFDFGLSLYNGELLDYGTLKTRFTASPVQVRRFGENYVYQTGNELRFLDLSSNNDTLIYAAPTSAPQKIVIDEGNWQVFIYSDDGTITRIDLQVPSAASAS
ncbi:MAG TPA: PEGA domain-containing protein [Candidatus Saccharimonadales bacterium]|nr:PEGA domain-containing protein [Candidatus Saccharimonadales bacterium]